MHDMLNNDIVSKNKQGHRFFFSSAGFRVLIVAAKTMKKNGGKMVLCCLRQHVIEVLEISGLKAMFKIVESYEEALASIDS
jgi:anti-anti-sigma factor